MRCSIVTLFPEYFAPLFATSMVGRAVSTGKLNYELINPRDFTFDPYHTVDDRPYGGGPGMIMKIEPIAKALSSIGVAKGQPQTKIILLSARGEIFQQSMANELSHLEHVVLICGHYGDVDHRVAEYLVDSQLSIGQFVLSGGEPAALVVIDAVSRLLPGVLGNEHSLLNESHQEPQYISPPQYTRPATYAGWKVPEELLSGDPQQIKAWQQLQLKRS